MATREMKLYGDKIYGGEIKCLNVKSAKEKDLSQSVPGSGD